MNASKPTVLSIALVLGTLFWGGAPPLSFTEFAGAFRAGYNELNSTIYTLDLHDRLRAGADQEGLFRQAQFFNEQGAGLARFDRAELSASDQLLFDLMDFEIDLNQYRIGLEQRWTASGRPIPERSLFELPEHAAWYSYFVLFFTGTDITPEEVFALGVSETDRCSKEIAAIRTELGVKDSATFHQHLTDQRFYITDKQKVMNGFAQIDSTVRVHLPGFVGAMAVPEVHAEEWPDAGPNTPPGIYRGAVDSALTNYVFQFNFFGGRYNTRAMSWLYMHEAIPGHHLQVVQPINTTSGDLREDLFYSGTAEGWACYVEYYGADLGLYTDPYQRLGKWEWDLVRSVRLVLDAGIHYYGWSHAEALTYWKAHVPGQDDIAEREVMRVTNWAAQALSYKVGASRIQAMRDRYEAECAKKGSAPDVVRFHRALLGMGRVPIAVVERNMVAALEDR